MSFEGALSKGDRVVYVYEEGVYGTVVYPFCDYGEHRVAVKWDDEEAMAEIGYEMYETAVLLVEDPYEYGVQLSSSHGPGRIRKDDWMVLEDAQNELEAFEGDDGHDLLTYKLVKRRKAGKVEDV